MVTERLYWRLTASLVENPKSFACKYTRCGASSTTTSLGR